MAKPAETPKSIYQRSRRERTPLPELEATLARPYNPETKRFVTKAEHHHPEMFQYALAYLRHTLGNSPRVHRQRFMDRLERNLLRHFDAHALWHYSNLLEGPLPERLHSRVVLQGLVEDDHWVRAYLEKWGKPKPKKAKDGFLGMPNEIHNLLLQDPDTTEQQILDHLRRRGFNTSKATKGLITRKRKELKGS
jgi:hypothetical protein